MATATAQGINRRDSTRLDEFTFLGERAVRQYIDTGLSQCEPSNSRVNSAINNYNRDGIPKDRLQDGLPFFQSSTASPSKKSEITAPP